MNPFDVYIDWNNNGSFGDANENVTEYLQGPFRWSVGKDQLRSFAPAMTGDWAGTLNNISGLFSTWNTGSALSGLLEPGKRIQIQMKLGAGGVLLFVDASDFHFVDGDVFESLGAGGGVVGTYILDDLRHNPDRAALTVDIPGLGVLSQLRGKKISTRVYQNISTSDALHVILDAIGWPAADRDIQTGLTTLSYWWLDNEDAFDAAERLKVTEGPGATLTNNLAGQIVFENRESRTLQPTSITPQATFTDDDWHTVGLNPSQNYHDKLQACKLVVDELAPAALSPLWQYGQDLVLGSEESASFEIRGSGAFINALVPDPTPSNTIWKFEGDQRLLSGTFKLRYNGQLTSAIPWNASGTTIAMALEALSTIGTGNATGSGSSLATGPVFVELVGAFAGFNITDVPTIEASTLNPVAIPGGIEVTEIQPGLDPQVERQRFTAAGVLVSGEWSATITYDGNTRTTANLPFDATADEIAEAFGDLPGLSLATANFGPIHTTPVDVNYIPITENIENAIINSDPANPLMMNTPSATVTVSQSQQGGVADYIASSPVASITLSEASGTSSMLTITAGAGGTTLTGLRVRGQLLTVARTHQVTYPIGAINPNARVYQPNIWPYIPLAYGQTYAESFYTRYSVLRPSGYVEIETPLDDLDGLASIFQYRVSYMITVVNSHLGLNHPATIEQIEYQTGDGEELHLITRIGWELAA